MAAERIDELLGGLSTRVAPQEFVQSGGDAPREATNAIYVFPEEIEDRSFLVQQLTIAVGLQEIRDKSKVVGAQPTPTVPVYLGRYPGFSVCVQAFDVDRELEALAKTKIETALVPVIDDERWKFLQLDRVPPVVDTGCPAEPLVSRPGVSWNASLRRLEGDAGYYVEAPSFYHTFVFIMSPERIHSLLGGLSIRLAPQEFRAEGDVVHMETNAIYLSPEELQDTPFLTQQLMFAIGFDSRDPE
jgi:hypothetical protein